VNHDDIRRVFDKHNTDKGKDHGYEHMYADLFSRYNPSSILEMGVEYGHSIAAWKELFPNAIITGVDIVEHDLVLPKTSFDYIIGDSCDGQTIELVNKQHDIIIDDASNDLIDQALTFENFKHSFNCCYVIEDIYSHSTHQNDRVGVLEKNIHKKGFNNTKIFFSKKKRNGVLINTVALIIYRK
jgi:hypothetical protein